MGLSKFGICGKQHDPVLSYFESQILWDAIATDTWSFVRTSIALELFNEITTTAQL